MKMLFVVLMLGTFIAPLMLHASGKAKTPDTPIYVFTNDDALRHTYASV